MDQGWASALPPQGEGRVNKVILGDEWGILEQEYPIHLNPGDTTDRLVLRADFDAMESDINEKNFPMTDAMLPSEVIVGLFRFPPGAHTDDILRGLVKHRYRPAYAHEAIALSGEFLGLQLQHSLVALGNSLKCHKRERVVVVGRRRNTHLLGSGEEYLRALKTSSKSRVWPGYYRVLAVKLP